MLLGPPGSGKTTLVAVLGLALMRHSDEVWRLRGTDLRSNEALMAMTDKILKNRRFPGTTESYEGYSWELFRPGPGAGSPDPFGLRGDRPRRVRLDLPEWPLQERLPVTGQAGDLLDSMESCGGFVFVYDPVSRDSNGDWFRRISVLFESLGQRLGRGRDGFLPQYLVLYVAKFDDPRVFRVALNAGCVAYDHEQDGIPYVPDEFAQEFFELLCRLSPDPALRELPRLLSRYFNPRRTRFCVSSAIGFHVSPRTHQFDPDDFVNVIPGPPERGGMIRGTARPINVAEPVLWLTGHVASLGMRRQPVGDPRVHNPVIGV